MEEALEAQNFIENRDNERMIEWVDVEMSYDIKLRPSMTGLLLALMSKGVIE